MADDLDLLELLSADHRNLAGLPPGAGRDEAISKHLTTERLLLYPLVARRSMCRDEEMEEMRSLDRSIEEAAAAGDESALRQAIDSHCEVQEALFGLVREGVDPGELVDLARRIPFVMEEAPTHLHPHAPDHGPLLEAVADIEATVDQAEDRIHGK